MRAEIVLPLSLPQAIRKEGVIMNSSTNVTSITGDLSRRSLAYLRWIPFLVLLTAVVILALSWEGLPERWATHWNLRGEPDRWTDKSVAGVMLPLFIGLGICTFIEIITSWIASLRTFGEGFSGEPEAAAVMAATTAGLVRLVNLAMSLIISLVAVKLPLFPAGGSTFVVIFAFGSIAIASIIGIRRITAAHRALKEAGLMEGVRGYNGLVYNNPDDPRLWVPKILGYGYTINFGHRLAWPVFLAILAIPLAVVVLVIALSAR